MKHLNRMALASSLLLVLGVGTVVQAGATPGQTTQLVAAGEKHQKRGRLPALVGVPVSVINTLTPLKDDQKTKITGIQDQFKADRKAAAGDKVKIKDLTQKANEDIRAQLTPDQLTAIQTGLPTVTVLIRAYTGPVVGDLNLTQDQLTKIQPFAQDAADKLKGISKTATPDDKKTQTKVIIDAFKTSVDTVLTDDQKKTIAQHRGRRGRKNAAGTTTTTTTGASTATSSK